MPLRKPSPRDLRRILDARPDPLGILKSTAKVVERMRRVTISLPRIRSVARVLSLRDVSPPAWNHEYHFSDGTERTLSYLFLLDTLNFSFWGTPRWKVEYHGVKLDGYWALAASLKRAVEEEIPIWDSEYLATLAPTDLAKILRGEGNVPMFVERWRNAQELGRVLSTQFGGSPARVVESASKDAPRLARLVADRFASFQDTTVYGETAVTFFKRAQILVADVWGAMDRQGWGSFKNVSELTAFADYKLPQILRAWGILQYKGGLAKRVDSREQLGVDSPEEVEIRSATLWAVELLREAFAENGRVLSSTEVDWFLWNSSQLLGKRTSPYHLVRTIYY